MTEAVAESTTSAPFVEAMFNLLWRRRPDHPTAQSLVAMPIQSAIQLLREVTGISHEDLAKRLFITIPQLNYITLRGKPMTVEYAERLTAIAKEYDIFTLYKYFEFETGKLKRRKNRKAPEGSLDR